jgi:hypothetical protein
VNTLPIDDLWKQGYTRLGQLLAPEECARIRALYADASLFRSRIDMQRYRFGRGEYQYFAYPLPTKIDELRYSLYEQLAPVAREWMAALSLPAEIPDRLDAFLDACRHRAQARPTPLILRYREGDFNCLHQDLYGAVFFPFQVVIAMSQPGKEYTGGELLLVEQVPRTQSVGRAITLQMGEGVVITTRFRPVRGSRGFYRSQIRHGVSAVLSGERYTLGVIFHDAE